jgi:hypothetical protein
VALSFYFSPTGMTAAKYDECIARLTKAGALHPAGRTYHACFGTDGQVNIFDVWESQASFERFGTTLVPILHAMGMDPGQPMVATVRNILVPPAKAARAARPRRAKASPKRKAAKGKAAKRKAPKRGLLRQR